MDRNRVNHIALFGDLRLSEICILLCFNCLAFQMFLQNKIHPAFSIIDELALLLLVVSSVFANKKSINNWIKGAILSLLLFICMGLFFNQFYQIQTEFKPILIDIVACSKFIVAMICLHLCFRSSRTSFSFNQIIDFESKLLIIVLVLCSIVSLKIDIGMSDIEFRYGFRAFIFIFNHPEIVNIFIIGLMTVLCDNYEKNKFWIAISVIPLILTMRTKSIGFVVYVFCIVLLYRKKRNFNAAPIMFAAILVLTVAWDQILNYYQNDLQARSRLMLGGIELANSYFPFGTGFATYGSAVTAEPSYYSPLYYQLGLSNVYGLSPSFSIFISDTFWPILFGQFGWVGTILYILSLFFVLKSALLIAQRGLITGNPGPFFAFMFVIGYLFISSLASSAFFAPMSIYLSFCLNYALHSGQHANIEGI